VAKCLPIKCKDLSSNPNAIREKKRENVTGKKKLKNSLGAGGGNILQDYSSIL
jgi:hypothetical protein